jgi:hypothetical protein
VSPGRAASAATLAACLCAATPAWGQAPTTVTMRPSFLPDRLGASTTFTLAFRFSGGEEGVPAPLSGMVVRMPAGMRIDLRGVGTCGLARLRRRGAAGCPSRSLVGRGRALLEVHAGSQTIGEESTIWIFRSPNRGNRPTFAIFGHGETPLDESATSTAILQPDRLPYGSKLTISVPPIPTLVYEPDASFSSLSVTMGRVGRSPRAHAAGAIVLPSSCPPGGFPFAASFTFADQSTASATATVPCP